MNVNFSIGRMLFFIAAAVILSGLTLAVHGLTELTMHDLYGAVWAQFQSAAQWTYLTPELILQLSNLFFTCTGSGAPIHPHMSGDACDLALYSAVGQSLVTGLSLLPFLILLLWCSGTAASIIRRQLAFKLSTPITLITAMYWLRNTAFLMLAAGSMTQFACSPGLAVCGIVFLSVSLGFIFSLRKTAP